MTPRVIPGKSNMTLGCERCRGIWDGNLLTGIPSDLQVAIRRCLRILANVQSLEELRLIAGLRLKRIGRGTRSRYEFMVKRRCCLRFDWRKEAATRVELVC